VSSEPQRNAAGDVIGAIRQCVNANGVPKIIYANETDAAASGLIPYFCDYGHWHVTSKKVRRPILIADA